MKVKANLLLLLLTVSLIATVPLIAATPIPKDPLVVWEPGGDVNAATLAWNPEYLQLRTEGKIYTETTVIIQGRDVYGQNIEAKVIIPGTPTAPVDPSVFFPFLDYHSMQPVAFAYIDRVFQQNGMHCNSFEIDTLPEPFEDYLGTYHCYSSVPAWIDYEPGKCYPAHATIPFGQYYHGQGPGTVPTVETFPVEPSNPDPLKVVINWYDSDGDLIPDSGEFPGAAGGGAKYAATLRLEGLDEAGNKLGGIATIKVGDKAALVDTYSIDLNGVWTPALHTWSTLCKVWGGEKGEEYYIFTEPNWSLALFEYFIRIDHMTIYPVAYDILANPMVSEGTTAIYVFLRDADGNLVNAREPVLINFATTGGNIIPSCDVWIWGGTNLAITYLMSDTNARTIKVSADANVPEHPAQPANVPELNLQAYTEMTFDGINSVLFTGPWPIHKLMCGYTVEDCHWEHFPAPGPDPIPMVDRLDGPLYEVMIPLYVGCNLISSPVYPMFGPKGYDIGAGIPMDLLFSLTSATDCIIAVWWYDAAIAQWLSYIPGVSDPNAYFTHGVGYWFKVEKACTLELSGVLMENAPFRPAEYPVYHSWNLMGFTSIVPMKTSDYLESLASGPGTYPSASVISEVGPVWVYSAQFGTWLRNPEYLWPTNAFWMNYKPFGTADLAP